jgi:hypothetical protein
MHPRIPLRSRCIPIYSDDDVDWQSSKNHFQQNAGSGSLSKQRRTWVGHILTFAAAELTRRTCRRDVSHPSLSFRTGDWITTAVFHS